LLEGAAAVVQLLAYRHPFLEVFWLVQERDEVLL
jgi:hypothetical protein